MIRFLKPRPALLLATSLAFTQVHAATFTLEGPSRVMAGGELLLTVKVGERPDLKVRFSVLDDKLIPIHNPARQGTFEDRGGGTWAYLAPRTARDQALVLRVTASDNIFDFMDLPITVMAGGAAAAAAAAAPPSVAEGLDLLPGNLKDLIHAYADDRNLGGGWPQTFHTRLPFFDPGTGSRLGAEAHPHPKVRFAGLAPMARFRGFTVRPNAWFVPYGLPVPVCLAPRPGAGGSLIGYRDAYAPPEADLRRREAHGDVAMVTFSGNPSSFLCEDLRSQAFTGAWDSRTSQERVLVRGMSPLAGRPGEPGSQDGRGIMARVQKPTGVITVVLPKGPGDAGHPFRTLFTDPPANTVGLVEPDGSLRTLFGSASAPAGFEDGDGAAARFNAPTFVAAQRARFENVTAWQNHAFVADSGNNAIRTLNILTGRVGTLNKTDFNNPQGLALLPATVPAGPPTLMVADQGHHVIQVLQMDGRTRVFAGHLGEAGTRDGAYLDARFHDLKGLAYDPGQRRVFVIDGNALRVLNAPAGSVTTLAGVVDLEGHAESLTGPLPMGTACFNHPCGLAFLPPNQVVIADTGNHAIRLFNTDTRRLRTLVGDPAVDSLRWGLLRDGAEHFAGMDYASLDAPLDVAFLPGATMEEGSLIVPSGACLSVIRGWHSPRTPVALDIGASANRDKLRPGELFMSCFTLRTTGGTAPVAMGPVPPFDFRFYVTFHDEHGTAGLLPPVEGTGTFNARVELPFQRFPAPGKVSWRLRLVLNEGWTLETNSPLTVVPAEPGR